MKYDGNIDVEDTNSSHGLIVRLIGSGKRVLDVGCANGQLGEVLQQRGNEVLGVELDPGLAEVAKSRMPVVVVGDVEQLDLVAEFGVASMDVVVFADVLEHLTNPLAALRKARGLLAEGGCVVGSIPNVAHGAVRLALLQGHFDYRELGLLDETHIRFFTRWSVDSLFRSADFVIEEWQQPVLGPFETEIPLSRRDFSPEIVAGVERDPDSHAYQFVVRAVPGRTPAGDQALASELVAKDRELESLRGEVAAIARHLGEVPRPPLVALLEAPNPVELPHLTRLRSAVMLAELRRRLVGFEVRAYTLQDSPAETGLVGEPARPLLPWDAARCAQLCMEAEAVVVAAGSTGNPDLEVVADDLAHHEFPLHIVTPESSPGLGSPPDEVRGRAAGTARPVPDPLALVGRLAARGFLLQRADYLTLVELLPQAPGFVLAYLTQVDGEDQAVAGPALESVARRADADLLLVDAPKGLDCSTAYAISSSQLAAVDLLAVVAAAALVITDSPGFLALTAGLARPALVLVPEDPDTPTTVAHSDQDRLSGRVRDLVALAPLAASEAEADLDQRRIQLAGNLDLLFDDLAGTLLSTGARQLRTAVPARLAELTEQIRTLEAVNAGLRQRLAREQTVIAEHLRQPVQQDRLGLAAQMRPGSDGGQWDASLAQPEIERLQKEIAAIYATRTMRVLQPARRLYGRLRSRRG